jgi:hypothetical protein
MKMENGGLEKSMFRKECPYNNQQIMVRFFCDEDGGSA